MTTTKKDSPLVISFDARRYSAKVVKMILAVASQMKCTPEEAVEHILNSKLNTKRKGAA